MQNFNYLLSIKTNNYQNQLIKKKTKLMQILFKKLNQLKKEGLIFDYKLNLQNCNKINFNIITVNKSPHVNNKSKDSFKKNEVKLNISIYGKTTNKVKTFLEINSIIQTTPLDFDINWKEKCL